jgi:hypothetical protein
MVLKRKLPSAVAKEAEKKEKSTESASISASQSAPDTPSKKVSFDAFADEVPVKKAPLAPEPIIESSESVIPEQSTKLSNTDSFQERHLPESDFSVEDKQPSTSPTDTSESTIDSWAEEPETSQGWDLDEIDSAKSSEEDVFGSMAEEVNKEQGDPSISSLAEETEQQKSDPLPPWQQGSVGSTAPELPEGTTFKNNSTDKANLSPAEIAARGAANLRHHEKAKPFGALVGVLLLVGIGFAGYSFFVEKDDTTEVISRWTGSLNEVSEEIPTGSDKVDTPQTAAVLQPESVVDTGSSDGQGMISIATNVPEDEMGDLMPKEGTSEPMEDEIMPEVRQPTASADVNTNTIVEFVDVPEDEVEQPIDAEGAPNMPKEVGVIVQLQQAIEQARQEKNPTDFKPTEEVVSEVVEEENNLEMLSPAELDQRNKDLSRQLEEELAEYRKILAGESSEDSSYKPSPNEYFDGLEENQDGSIAIPERQSALLSQQQAESLYGSNPYNLPVVPEPTYKEDTGIRTLEDYDVSMFQVERERVRIPKNVRPTFRATNFPPLILLSTVPKKGIIAELNTKQGVLLIGESVSGWELLSVKQEYAEFTNGKRKHIVSIGR